MKAQVAATLGLRLFGVIAILFGVVFVGLLAIPRYQWFLAPVSSDASDQFLHDTYEITYTAHFAPGVFSIVLGIISMVFSRPFGRLLACGLAEPGGEHKR
jgi:hypothetical protein